MKGQVMPTTMNVANSNGPVESDHWLICVAGSSPAVVTETLYCLKDRENFPKKVVIFTTPLGAFVACSSNSIF